MKKRVLVILISAICAMMISACGGTKSESQANTENSEEAAEVDSEQNAENEAASESGQETDQNPESPVFGEFLAITTDGEEVTQEIFAGADLTMVNIWGTFCGPCINEMPDLGEIAREYDGTGFQIVGIITDIYEYGDETVAEIIEVTGADYTHILLSVDLYNNYLNRVQVVPTTIFVDSEGKEVGIYTGSRSKEDWIEIIEELRGNVSEAGE